MEKNQKFKVFIVEDDEWFRNLLCHVAVLNPDFEVKAFATGNELLKALDENPDVVSLDYFLPDTEGTKLLKKIKEHDPDIEVLIVSKQDKAETAVELLRLGAYDYILKSNDINERFINLLNNLYKNRKLKKKISVLEKEVQRKYSFENTIVGNSPAIRKVFHLMEKASATNLIVLITGETGTGKELVAKAIHFNSARKKEPFVAVNMAAIPEDLIESELFGHEKGAFTGAVGQRKGKFELAYGGTLFLDEIGEMSVHIQSKLLRVLQEREFTRVGGNEVIKADCRIIAATNRNLAEEVKKGTFREDLYYRLYGLTIELPPLRERENDVLAIARSVVENFSKENNINAPQLSREAQQKLIQHPFPGNIRELKSVMELAAVMSNGSEITAADINITSTFSLSSMLAEEKKLIDYEKEIIRYFLKKNNQNVVTTAEKLGIGKSTIYRMLKDDPGFFGAKSTTG